MPELKPIVFENAQIIFRNFSGKEGTYNREGDRNFCLLLNEDQAEAMVSAGWNVKALKPREEDDVPQPYLEVKVNFRFKPPRILLITSRGRTDLDEESVSLLDWAEIKNVDLIVNPYEWEVSGKNGIKAYLKSIYVTIYEDELEMKYVDVPDSANSSVFNKPGPADSEDD